jgi:hypothetical protein
MMNQCVIKRKYLFNKGLIYSVLFYNDYYQKVKATGTFCIWMSRIILSYFIFIQISRLSICIYIYIHEYWLIIAAMFSEQYFIFIQDENKFINIKQIYMKGETTGETTSDRVK